MGACISFKETPIIDFIWHIIRCVIESLQFLSVFVEAAFEWPQAVLAVFSWLGYLRIDVDGAVFLTFFLLVFISFGSYIIIAIILLVCGEECCADLEDSLFEVLWYFIGDSILFGILFIPCSTLALQMFNCSKNENDGNLYIDKYSSMQCWTATHIILCIMSIIILIFIIIGIRQKAKEHDLSQHDAASKKKIRADVHNIDSRFAIIRFMGLILGINIAQISNVAASILMFLLFLYPLCYNVYYIPFVDMKYNYIYVAMHAFNAWSALSVIITVLTPSSWAGFVIWCIFPIAIGIACFLCKKRLIRRPLKPEDLQQDFDRSSINVTIQIDNPYLDEAQYKIVSQILINKKDQCLSFRPVHFGMFVYELQTGSAKIEQLKQQRKNKKKTKNKGGGGGRTDTNNIGDEQEDIVLEYEFRKDWVCIHASNQTELAKRDNLSDNEIDALCQCIVDCKELVVLRLNGWNLKDEILRRMIDLALTDSMNIKCRHSDLRVIDFGDNQMNADDATYILDKLYSQQQDCGDMMDLEEICLANNYIGDSKGSDLQREHPLGKILIV